MRDHIFQYRGTLIRAVLGVAILASVFGREVTAQAEACVRPAPGGTVSWPLTGVVAVGRTNGTCSANTNWSRVVPLEMSQTTDFPVTVNAGATGTISFTSYPGHLVVGLTVNGDEDLSDFDGVFLVFDRTNDGLNDDDFILAVSVDTTGWAAAGATNPRVANAGGTFCKRAGIIHYYRRQGGVFGIDDGVTLGARVQDSISWDYTTTDGDGEVNLWNVEIDIQTAAFPQNGHSYLGIQTTDFAMGAYVVADKGRDQTNPAAMVLRWPLDIKDFQEGAMNFAQIANGTLTHMTTNDVCFDVRFAGVSTFLQTTDVTGNNPTSGINRNGSTTFKIWYYYNGPGDTETQGQNQGNVRIDVMRATGGSFQPFWNSPSTPTSIGWYNKVHSVLITMPTPFGQAATDACSDIYLEGWDHDDDVSDASNHHHENHIPIATSQFVQQLDMGTDSVPGLPPGGSTNLVLHFTSTNDPDSKALGLRDNRMPDGLILAGLVLLVVGGAARRRQVIALPIILLGIGAFAGGCVKRTSQGTVGTDRWQLGNARELGITAIDGKPGWYHMPIRKGEIKHLQLTFAGRPLPYRTVTDSLRMAADSTGRPRSIRIPVKTGQIATILAFGTVDVDGPNGPLQPTTAAGLIRRDRVVAPTLATTAAVGGVYPLTRSRYIPSENVGTVIGSFDGGKTTFVIGTLTSVVVPARATELMVFTNGLPNDYRVATGAFQIKWTVTDMPLVPTATSYAYDTPYDLPTFVKPWLVLTAMHLYTYYEKPVKNPVSGREQIGIKSLGEAHVSVYESHVN